VDVNKVMEELKQIRAMHESAMKEIAETKESLELIPGI
jgi:hypothetical protein